MDEFEWETHRLNTANQEAETIEDTVNEFNIQQIKRKTRRIHKDNDALDTLQEIITDTTKQLADNPTNLMLITTLTRLGKFYTQLEDRTDKGTLTANNVKTCITTWKEIKERLTPHHNPATTEEEHLQTQLQSIDYYFEEYADE